MSPVQLQNQLSEAVAHHRAGRLAQADALYRRLRVVAPRNFDVTHLSGVLALQQGHFDQAAGLLGKARQLNPKHPVCLMRHALALNGLGRSAEAEQLLRTCVELNPQFVEAWDNLAFVLKVQDRLPAAIECHQRVVALKPGYAPGWYNYGLTLSLFGRIADALACHERAITADPAYAKAHYGRAQALQQSHRIPEAVAEYGTFLEMDPTHAEARSYRLFAQNYLDSISREQLFAEHVAYGRRVGLHPVPSFPHGPDPARRLRVGFLGTDFRAHSCAYFLEPLLRHLDRSQFELYLYHDHFREDAVSARFKACATVWRSTVTQSGPVLERTIRADQPDILVDLTGHTGMTVRLPLFARHLAPVQVTYLGYPNTTGLPAIGYRFTDETADPTGEADAFATEQLIRFAPTAWAYQPEDTAPAVQPPPCTTGQPLTFGCFNNLTKLNDSQLVLWARLLAAVPGSRLLLKGRGLSDDVVRARYFGRLTAAGLPLDRVELLERTAKPAEHLALYHRVDVALDTMPYNGTTTTCEALWMGVPVVTQLGDRHAGRVSASLLTAIGHEAWIGADADDYVRIAVDLASDPVRLATLRTGLREEMRSSALMDYPAQAARFGDALRRCWTDWCMQQAVASAPATRAD